MIHHQNSWAFRIKNFQWMSCYKPQKHRNISQSLQSFVCKTEKCCQNFGAKLISQEANKLAVRHTFFFRTKNFQTQSSKFSVSNLIYNIISPLFINFLKCLAKITLKNNPQMTVGQSK